MKKGKYDPGVIKATPREKQTILLMTYINTSLQTKIRKKDDTSYDIQPTRTTATRISKTIFGSPSRRK